MISASRRIFWHSFQPYFKKTRIVEFICCVSLGCNIPKYCFSNQNKLWNMLQAAFDHEKLFFDAPKAWKAVFKFVFKVISSDFWHFSKNVQNQFWPMLKYTVFYAEFESDIRFVWNPLKIHIMEYVIFTWFYFFVLFMLGVGGMRRLPLNKSTFFPWRAA